MPVLRVCHTVCFHSFDNAAGSNNTVISQRRVAGVNGAFATANNLGGEIGSPGVMAVMPEPKSAAGAAGTARITQLFNAAPMGPPTLSDIQTLSAVEWLVGTNAADKLRVLRLGSRRLIEVTRTGKIDSSFDFVNILAHNGIEGVTVGAKGNINLVAEQLQHAFAVGISNPQSQLIVLTAPVPEPATCALMLAGLGLVAF